MSQDAKQRTSIATQRKRLTAGEYIDSEQCRGKKGPADREGRRGSHFGNPKSIDAQSVVGAENRI